MKTFIKGVRRPSGRVVEVEYNDGGPQSIQNTIDGVETQPKRGALRTWVTTDAINGSFVHFRSKGVYASLMDDQSFLAFIAKTIGEVGNNFSVEYIAPDQDEPLLVTVTGNKITVKLHTTGDAVAASLETALGISNAELLFTAKEAGVDGNDIGVEYSVPGSGNLMTTASASGTDITVECASDAGTPAHFTQPGSTWGPGFPNVGLTRAAFTLDALVAGSPTLAFAVVENGDPHGYIGGGPYSVGDVVVRPNHAAVDYAIYYITANNGSENGQDVVDAINGDSTASTLVVAATEHSTDTFQSYGNQAFAFVGNVDPVSIATANDVKTAIEADTDSDALVSVEHASGNDGSGVVSLFGPQNLSGGTDAGQIANTASDVKTAIEADSQASKLVTVVLQDDQIMFEMSERNLSGGDDNAIMEGSVELS